MSNKININSIDEMRSLAVDGNNFTDEQLREIIINELR